MQIFDPPPEPRRPDGRRPRLRLPKPGGLPRLPALPATVRRPLVWAIAAEVLVTCGFAVAALHLLAATVGSPVTAALPGAQPSVSQSPGVPDVAGLVAPGSTAGPTPHPGLGQSSAFLGGLLSGLNRDQASFEHQQWSVLQALSAAIRAYIENVVLPAVEKAAHSGQASTHPP